MPFKIIRNDITKMNTEAIVNTANDRPTVGTGCDHAVYEAAGYDELLSYRKEKIGFVPEGDAFITPGFHLPAKYIIHAVSPLFIDGQQGEEELLRSCYRKSLALAAENGIRSIAFPLISTGGFGYPKEEGMRIAVDEIHAFLLHSDMLIYLVVFDEKATRMGKNLYPELEAYIDLNYVEEKRIEEYGGAFYSAYIEREEAGDACLMPSSIEPKPSKPFHALPASGAVPPMPNEKIPSQKESARRRWWQKSREDSLETGSPLVEEAAKQSASDTAELPDLSGDFDQAIEEMERKLEERMKHISDTFSQYLLYLISEKGLTNAEVYKSAIIDKKVFSKIKGNPDYHPQKKTALCLCIGAKLNLDESRDLLSRAGYALSPCDKTDIIFSFFIENKIYDMIELDIQLEEHGLPCMIS